jgi:hypothetical protein
MPELETALTAFFFEVTQLRGAKHALNLRVGVEASPARKNHQEDHHAESS